MPSGPASQPVSLALLESALSKPRLDRYRLSTTDTLRMIVGRYRWNLALSKALYPELQMLEVVFRNRMHDGLAFHFRAKAWFDLSWLSSREQEDISIVKQRLQRDGLSLEPDRIVAALDFGFWTSLLSSSYDKDIWTQSPFLHTAFPYMPRRCWSRRFLSGRMNALRKLRNRIFHHEPIWRTTDLPQKHAELQEMLHWLAPGLLRALGVPHHFEDVFAQGSQAYEHEVS